MLAGKRIVVTGVVNRDSIAYAVAERALRDGAEVVLTTLGRDRELTEEAIDALTSRPPLFELDATSGERHDELAGEFAERWGTIDGLLHAVAFAPRSALNGEFVAADPDGVNLAFQTSAFSLAHSARLVSRLAPETGASLVGLDFAADRAWPVYNWMGVCKAALEATNRYLARDLGARLIRANLVAAGPLITRAASGIGDFDRLLDSWAATSPLPWNANDASPVADAVCFLLSDLSRAITGQVLHVDGGHSAMAAPLR